MKDKPFVAFLDISDMLGSIGAEHYYGKILFRHDERREVELTWPMTAKEALYLNKKSGTAGFNRYKAGEESYKFYSPDDVIRAAKKYFEANHPHDLLLKGDGCGMSAQPLVYWPTALNALATRINRLAAKWEKIGGYGDWRGRGGNEKLASEIDAKWYALIKPYLNHK